MGRKLVIFVTVLVIAHYAACLCNVCGTESGVQCTGETTFNICQGGVPTTQRGTCPSGLVCTDTPYACTALTPDCTNECGACDPSGSFACISQTEFAFCYGASLPSTTTGTCPAGTFCNLNAQPSERCVASAIGPSCTTSSTTNPPTQNNPTATCQRINTAGRYLVGGSSCKRYLYCYVLNGSIVGEELSCPGTTLFNPVLQQCVSNYFCRF